MRLTINKMIASLADPNRAIQGKRGSRRVLQTGAGIALVVAGAVSSWSCQAGESPDSKTREQKVTRALASVDIDRYLRTGSITIPTGMSNPRLASGIPQRTVSISYEVYEGDVKVGDKEFPHAELWTSKESSNGGKLKIGRDQKIMLTSGQNENQFFVDK
jgi:hypothetical protein